MAGQSIDPAKEESISFSVGKRLLQGVLHLPAKKASPVVVGSHGLLADKSSPKQIALATHCARAGIAFFRFDHGGCGESPGGDLSDIPLMDVRCAELEAAIITIGGRPDIDNHKIGLFGSSFGGAVCLKSIPVLKGGPVVTWAAPQKSGPVLRFLEKTGGTTYRTHPLERLVFDITDCGPLKNILILHGENDEVVPATDAHKLFAAARYPKRLRLFSGGDHRMRNSAHQTLFLREALGWYERHFSCP